MDCYLCGLYNAFGCTTSALKAFYLSLLKLSRKLIRPENTPALSSFHVQTQFAVHHFSRPSVSIVVRAVSNSENDLKFSVIIVLPERLF